MLYKLSAVPNGGRDARVAEARDTGRDDEAVRRFVERFALDLVEAGMARMPARVFAALLADDDGQLTAAELAERLHVSPAAISGAVRYLQQVGVVARGREPGERRDHYRVSSETWYEAVTRRDQILARWMDDLQQGIKAVGLDTPAGARLEETREFFEFLHDEVPKAMVRWREQRSAGQSG
jgi:DNA-binding transcriptional regulator GbsR (MarR family)